MSGQLSQMVRYRLAELGIRVPDVESELHQSLIDVFSRLGTATPDVLLPAVMWCYHAEHDRQVLLYARAKTEAERVVGAGVIRYRSQGERSAEVARMRAEAEDEGVYQARLQYRASEQMIISAKKALDILHAQLSAWQTNRADERQSDAFMAKNGV